MDLTECVFLSNTPRYLIKAVSSVGFKSVTIPQKDDPRLASFSKRLETCKPLGMFRCSENEFLLCYDGESSHLTHVIC
jgi:CNH domain